MKKLNKKGVMSILMIVLIVIAITVAKGVISVMQNAIFINELQGVMDMVGMNALRDSVDTDRWLEEEKIVIDESTVYAKYNSIFYPAVEDLREQAVDINLDNTYLHQPNSPAYKSLGIPTGERAQYFFESTVRVYLPRDGILGASSLLTTTFYNFFKGMPGMSNSKYFTLEVHPHDDNTNAYVVRSISRLVLR